jgi:hypothetical protein
VRCNFATGKVPQAKQFAFPEEFSWLAESPWGIIQVPGNECSRGEKRPGCWNSPKEKVQDMKKLLIATVAALGVAMACEQKASAWSEFKFSAGVNFGWIGGGNRVFWGLYRSAPYPGGPDLPPVVMAQPPAPYGPGPYGPPPGPYGPDHGSYGAPYGQGYPGYPGYPGMGNNAAFPGGQTPAPAQAPAPMAPVTAPQSYNPYFNSGYQPVGYYPGYSSAEVPSYWYRR